MTSAGWLRPAVARELIELLSLYEWHESIFGHSPDPCWSSADHLGIDALFTLAVASGLLEYRGNRVVSVASEHPEAFLRVVTLVSLYRVVESAAGRALLGGARRGLQATADRCRAEGMVAAIARQPVGEQQIQRLR